MPWGLGVPADRPTYAARPTDLAAFADRDWIVNSRNTADEEVVRTLASMAGFTPRIAHRIDSLELVEDLIVAGPGRRAAARDDPADPPGSTAAARRPGCRAAGVRRDPPRPGAPGRRCALVLDRLAADLSGSLRVKVRPSPLAPTPAPTRRRHPRNHHRIGIQKSWPRQV